MATATSTYVLTSTYVYIIYSLECIQDFFTLYTIYSKYYINNIVINILFIEMRILFIEMEWIY